MTPWLRALVALPEDQGSQFPEVTDSSQLLVTPVPRVPIPFSGLHGHCLYAVYTHTCRQKENKQRTVTTHTHKSK